MTRRKPKRSEEVIIEAEFVEGDDPVDAGDDDETASVDFTIEADGDLVDIVDQIAPFPIDVICWTPICARLPTTDGYVIVLPTLEPGICVGVVLDLDEIVREIAPQLGQTVAGAKLNQVGENAVRAILARLLPGVHKL